MVGSIPNALFALEPLFETGACSGSLIDLYCSLLISNTIRHIISRSREIKITRLQEQRMLYSAIVPFRRGLIGLLGAVVPSALVFYV